MTRYDEASLVRELATIEEEKKELNMSLAEEDSKKQRDCLNYRERICRLELATLELQKKCGLEKKQIRHG